MARIDLDAEQPLKEWICEKCGGIATSYGYCAKCEQYVPLARLAYIATDAEEYRLRGDNVVIGREQDAHMADLIRERDPFQATASTEYPRTATGSGNIAIQLSEKEQKLERIYGIIRQLEREIETLAQV